MKALSDAKALLLKEKRKLEDERDAIGDRIYRLQQGIDAMESAESLKRIRRVTYPKVCPACSERFYAKKEDTVFCNKRDCRIKARQAKRKGIKLVAGEQK